MRGLSLGSLALLPLLVACDQQGESFDDVEAIAAAKVEVCHFNNGAHEYNLIDVAESSVEAHLAHGDTLYVDDTNCNGVTDSDGEWILVECMEDYGVGSIQELVNIAAANGYGDEVQCMCDCGFCPTCGDHLGGCACSDIPVPPL